MKRLSYRFLAGCLVLQAGLAQGQQRADVSPVNDSHEIPFQLRESYLIAVEGRIYYPVSRGAYSSSSRRDYSSTEILALVSAHNTQMKCGLHSPF
jgi:hypothetical protein